MTARGGEFRLASALHPLYRHVAFPIAQRVTRAASLAALRDLRASEFAPPHVWRTRQEDRLRRLARWAYDTVPAYRRRFDESGVRPDDIGTAADLVHLPVLTKRDLQSQRAAFWSAEFGRDRHWVQVTSGSTGEPLRAVRDAALRPVGQGTWWHTLERCGVHPADAMIDIAAHQSSDRPWQKPWRQKTAALVGSLPLAMSKLFARDLTAINALLRGWRPKLISGQPHRLAQLARMVVEGDVRVDAPPRAVSYYGSMLTDMERGLISRAFPASIHSRYGAVEFVPYIAYTCDHRWFHVNAHYFIVEIVDGARGARAGRPAREGRVLITDLTNLVAPYLRYEVGDLASWADGTCPCGRTWPRLAHLLGRHAEVAVTASGREISQSGLSRVMFKAAPDLPDVIWEYQFRQHALDEIELCVVPRPEFRDPHVQALRTTLEAYTGGEVRFRVTRAREIPVPPRGEKRPLLVNLMTPPPAGPGRRTEP